MSNFLDMLRSASVNDNEGLKASEKSHAEWKVEHIIYIIPSPFLSSVVNPFVI